MGYINSPAVLQRTVNHSISDLKGYTVWVIMDDRSIGTKEENYNILAVDEVLTRLQDEGMKLKFSKCDFGNRNLEILGHFITPGGLLFSKKHIEEFTTLRMPENDTELLRLIGQSSSTTSQIIPQFADRMRPLHAMLVGSGFNNGRRYRSQRFILQIGRIIGDP